MTPNYVIFNALFKGTRNATTPPFAMAGEKLAAPR